MKYTKKQREQMIEALESLERIIIDFWNKYPEPQPEKECTCLEHYYPKELRVNPSCPIHGKKDEECECVCPVKLNSDICANCHKEIKPLGKPLPKRIELLKLYNYSVDLRENFRQDLWFGEVQNKINEIAERVNELEAHNKGE